MALSISFGWACASIHVTLTMLVSWLSSLCSKLGGISHYKSIEHGARRRCHAQWLKASVCIRHSICATGTRDTAQKRTGASCPPPVADVCNAFGKNFQQLHVTPCLAVLQPSKAVQPKSSLPALTEAIGSAFLRGLLHTDSAAQTIESNVSCKVDGSGRQICGPQSHPSALVIRSSHLQPKEGSREAQRSPWKPSGHLI